MDETMPFKTLHSREYQGHKKKVHSVAWNCSGTKLASGSVDQTARVWHIEPHGHNKFGCGRSQACKQIEMHGGKVKDIELKGHTDSVDQLCWDPKHADLIATASGDKTVRMWDVRK
ncbi:THO complex subunit 3 [Orobanche hederae]